MTELFMRKVNGKLEVSNHISAEDFARLPAGKDLRVKVTVPRNPKLEQKMWVLARMVADACDWLHDKDDGMEWLKIRARYCKFMTNPMTGHLIIVPKSLTELDGPAQSRLFERMVYVTCTEIIPGINEGDLRGEIEALCAGNQQRERVPA